MDNRDAAPLDPDQTRATAILAILDAELDPRHQRLVHELVSLTEYVSMADGTAAVDQLVEGLAAHLPGMAPAIRALALHVAPNRLADRCRDQCSHPWPACGQYWQGEEEEEVAG